MVRLRLLFIIILLSSCGKSIDNEFEDTRMKLFYEHPAEEWTEALPVGNGRIGAMIFGKTDSERIQINEESLFAGAPMNDNNPKALEYLPEIRQLLLQGRNPEALELAEKYLLATPPRLRSYQPLMDLFITFENNQNINNYRRELNLITGVHETSYDTENGRIIQTIFASAPSDIIVIKITQEGLDGLNCMLSMSREKDAEVTTLDNNTLLLEGQIIDEFDSLRGPGGEHMKFAGLLKAEVKQGEVTAKENQLEITNASEIEIRITGATDYDLEKLGFNRSVNPADECSAILSESGKEKYSELLKNHILDHSQLMNRFALQLGSSSDTVNLPTDQRLQLLKQGKPDPELAAMYVQYGRYLLMGSSRSPGELPANLQGIWNEHMNAPWNADYHTNINLQMNYWPAEAGNLPETVIPLIDFMHKYQKPGKRTASVMYGADGWTMHHNTTIFGRTGLHDRVMSGIFPMGGPWMTFPVWRHYEYTLDTNYLSETAYPLLKGSAEFINDFLIEGPDGFLVTAPSYSPENTFVHPESRKHLRLTYAPTMDIQIIREVFNYTIKAGEILNRDQEFRNKLRKTLEKLPPVQIGKDGTIQEWINDYEEVEPGHRHISHLLGLHPGSQISADNEEMFQAAKTTIERRLSFGGGHTGWSRAWIINFYARLLDGDKAHEHVQALFTKSTLPNLFDTHPPFQIDGNFGGSAGIMEMLLQSHTGAIHLLPALPEKWPEGSVKGIKARGNFELDIRWQNGQLDDVILTSNKGGKCQLKYQDKTISLDTEAGSTYELNGNLELK